MSEPSAIPTSTRQFDGLRFVKVVGTPVSSSHKFCTPISPSLRACRVETQAYRKGGDLYRAHSLLPDRGQHGPLIWRCVRVRPDAANADTFADARYPQNVAAYADDVDDDC